MTLPAAAARRSTWPRPIAGCARTRPGRSCSTSASRHEFAAVRAPGAVLLPTSTFTARLGRAAGGPAAARRSATPAAAPRR